MKRRSSPYRSGRSPHWLKAKNPESAAARREPFEIGQESQVVSESVVLRKRGIRERTHPLRSVPAAMRPRERARVIVRPQPLRPNSGSLPCGHDQRRSWIRKNVLITQRDFELFCSMTGLTYALGTPATNRGRRVDHLTSNQHRRGVMICHKLMFSFSTAALVSILASPALADCSGLPTWQSLKTAVTSVVVAGGNGGLGFNMWATLVATDGTVCAVAFSGRSYTDQWLGSRVISAQKANTANAFSLGQGSTPASSLFGTKGLALSTANLFTAVQPGGSLYGLQHSNPVDTEIAYGNDNGPPPGFSDASFRPGPSNPQDFGTPKDPMIGQRIGGVNVFGGGLALYRGGTRVGGLGVSGDTSCTDHMVAWNVRYALGLDQLQGVPGVSGDASRPDNIIFDIFPNGGIATNDGGTGQAPNGTGGVGQSKGGFGHPKCLNNPDPAALHPVK